VGLLYEIMSSIRNRCTSDDCINEFNDRADLLFKKWMNNFSENLRLSEIRDTLLPKLLSGELSVEVTELADEYR
jgi:type I restriction enzyme S subunit